MALVLAACDRASPPATVDTAVTDSAATVGPVTDTAMTSSGWDAGAGPLLVLSTLDGGFDSGSLLRPDATELTVGDTAGMGELVGDGRFDLLSRAGPVGVARVTVNAAPPSPGVSEARREFVVCCVKITTTGRPDR